MKNGRKISGAKYHAHRKRRLRDRGRQTRIVRLAEEKTKKIRVLGGHEKIVSLSGNYANVIKNKKARKVKIKNVIETPSNRFFARQNVIVKGAIIETEIGNARVTNRPSQEGTIQAVIINEKE